jgi:hypothetical protein
MVAFKKAVKISAKLRMALAGPAGSGKTYTALLLAREIAGGQPVAVIDTERGSASKYADLFDFDVLEMDTFHPTKYVEAIRAAEAEGYAVIVIDSLTHAWNGKGGILEIVQRKGNSFQAWGEVKPIENALLEAITGSRVHIIATMRTKTEYVVEQTDKGKAAPRKVGTAPIQRDGLEYEFDVFGELDQENTLTIEKTRCPALTGAVIAKPGSQLADTLRTWLTGVTVEKQAPVVEEPRFDRAPDPKPAPKPQSASPADDLGIGEFVRAGGKLGMTSQQMADRLGVKQGDFHKINRREALVNLQAGVIVKPEEPTPEPEPEIAFVEEDHSIIAEWDPYSDAEFHKAWTGAGIKNLGELEDFLSATFNGQSFTKADALQALDNAEAARDRTPDLKTLPRGKGSH